jgi:hypothetical protein
VLSISVITMGVSGYDAAHKRVLLMKSILYNVASLKQIKFQIVSIDMCAAVRKALNPTTTGTPRVAMAIVLNYYKSLTENAEIVIYAFDRYDLIPEKRHQHHEKTTSVVDFPKPGFVQGYDGLFYRAGTEPPPAGYSKHIAPDSECVSLARILSTQECKQAYWMACADVIRDMTEKRQTGKLVVVLDTLGTVTIQPHSKHAAVDPTRFGEGEMSSIYIARQMSIKYNLPDVLMVTNDVDMMMLSMSLGFDFNVSNGRSHALKTGGSDPVEYHPDIVTTMSSTADKKFKKGTHEPVFEISTTPSFVLPLGKNGRLNYMFMAVFSGKFDYSDGGMHLGFSHQTSYEFTKRNKTNITSSCKIVKMSETDGVKTLHFDPNRLRIILKKMTDPKLKFRRKLSHKSHTDEMARLNVLMHDIVWILRYWNGFDAARSPGGPVLPDYTVDIFQSKVTTITEFIAADADVGPIYSIAETHPLTVIL